MADAKRMLAAAVALSSAILAYAPAAGADYLYELWNGRESDRPYVMVILDTSGSMDATDKSGGRCPYGYKTKEVCVDKECTRGYCTCTKWETQPTSDCNDRMTAAKEVLSAILPRISTDVGLGLMIFAHKNQGGTIPSKSQSGRSTYHREYCGVKTVAAPPADYDTLHAAIASADATTNTPLEFSLDRAHQALKAIRDQDDSTCRDYYVILVTDGEDSCVGTDSNWETAGPPKVIDRIKKLRADGIRTFVVGFGKDLVDSDGSSNMSKYARAGGTATDADGNFVCWDDSSAAACAGARAMFAYASDELAEALTRSFEQVRQGVFSAAEPIIASVPTRKSEVDRIARNLMVYSAFEKSGDKMRGRLYAIRLFEENGEYSNDWQFTDLSDTRKLLSDCGPDKTCIFEAGQMLDERRRTVGHPRKILTGLPGTPITDNGGFTVPVESVQALPATSAGVEALGTAWEKFSDLEPIEAALENAQLPSHLALTGSQLREPPESLLEKVIGWLHGTTREWPLGDMFHGSPTVVEPPSYGYRDRGYPQFRMAQRDRPWMIYTGANDGMIHAFYASPDYGCVEKAGVTCPRWQPGEEAWAYLPMNLIGRTLDEVKRGSERFFSMDLSCRYTDVIVDDKVDSTTKELECGDDPNCGWATILLCGQGWGGSWYVAIDVTEPADPKPLWEMTVPASGEEEDGLGRTWSVPALNLINLGGKPRWAALFGNGYNADMRNCPSWDSNSGKCKTGGGITYGTRASYRMLNFPFDGAWPEYGDGTDGDLGHAFLVDVPTGRLMKKLHMHAKQGNGTNMLSLVADVAAIDSDFNGMIDAAYLGGWDGSLARVYFGDKKTDSLDDIGVCVGSSEVLTNMGTSRPITSNPAVVTHPVRKDGVYLFVGSGVDWGLAPDQQRNSGNQWDFRAFQFDEKGTSACIQVPNAGNLCKQSDWKLDNRARLLGQPLFSRQYSGRDWLVYTSWTPPTGGCGGAGVARLWCLDVTDASGNKGCVPCGDLDGDGDHEPDRSVEIDTGGTVPSPPVMADGVVYVGPLATPVYDADGNGPRPNANHPRTVTISWREIF